MDYEVVHNEDIEVEEPLPGVLRQVVAGAGVTIALATAKGGLAFDQHSHPHEQAVYVVQGKAEFVAGENKMPCVLEAGDFILFAPNCPHGVRYLEDSTLLDIFCPIREDLAALAHIVEYAKG